LHVCTCLAGAPAAVSTPSASRKFAKAAATLWKEMRIDADDMLGGGGRLDAGAEKQPKTGQTASASPHQQTAEIDVPPLYRRAVEIDPALDASSASFDREAAYRELYAARRRAAEAAAIAAAAAAAAGIPDYAPPRGVQLPEGFQLPRPDPEHAARAALILRAAAAARASVERRRAAERELATAPRVALSAADAKAAIAAGASVEVLWPDDGQWWPARVQAGAPGDGGDHLFYGTGEQERGVDLGAMAGAGEIAWSGPERARCLALYRSRLLEAEREKQARKAERAAERAAARRQLTQQMLLLQQQQQMQQQQQQMQQQQQQMQQQQQQQQQMQQQHFVQQQGQQGQQGQQQQQHITVCALVAAGAATRGAGVAVRLAATGQVLRGTVLGPVHGGSGLGVQLEGGAGAGAEAARAVELRVERDGVDFHVFLELGG